MVQTRSQSKRKPEHRVEVVDVGTELNVKDIQDYEGFIATLLAADKVRVVRIAKNVNGVFVNFLEVFGDIGAIAMARLRSRGSGFCLKWVEDATDHGDLNLSSVIFRG
tara:strand:+ start:149 stop:472 length:324 start_codon:yes stop_codon:yes gene_type:complete